MMTWVSVSLPESHYHYGYPVEYSKFTYSFCLNWKNKLDEVRNAASYSAGREECLDGEEGKNDTTWR